MVIHDCIYICIYIVKVLGRRIGGWAGGGWAGGLGPIRVMLDGHSRTSTGPIAEIGIGRTAFECHYYLCFGVDV